MTKTSPWHSAKESVYHDNTDCEEGNNIEKEDRREGPGGRRKCARCKRLDDEEWILAEQGGPVQNDPSGLTITALLAREAEPSTGSRNQPHVVACREPIAPRESHDLQPGFGEGVLVRMALP